MPINFKKQALDGEIFLKKIAAELGAPDELAKAGRILRAVLHALRDRIQPAESLDLIAQLPMAIKAVYVDGWRIAAKPQAARNVGDFIESVREAGGSATADGFTTDFEVEKAIRAVFAVLKKQVSAGEIKDVLATLPADLQVLFAVPKRTAH